MAEKCRACGKPLEKGANRCSYCHAYQNWQRWTGDLNALSITTIIGAVSAVVVGFWQISEIQARLTASEAQQAKIQKAVSEITEITAFPISVELSENEVALAPESLQAFMARYLEASPQSRSLMKLEIEEPELARQLRARPEARLESENLTESDREYVLAHVEDYRRRMSTINGNLTSLFVNAFEMASGRTGRSAEGVKTVVQRAVQRYVRISLPRALDTIRRANLIKDVKHLEIPSIVRDYKSHKDSVIQVYVDAGLPSLRHDDMEEIEFGGSDVTYTRIYVPAPYLRIVARDKLEQNRGNIESQVRDQMRNKGTTDGELTFEAIERVLSSIRIEGPGTEPEQVFSDDFWLEHAVWQILSREEGLRDFKMGWRPYYYDLWGLP